MRDFWLLTAVAVCGAIGAMTRYTVSHWAGHWSTGFPSGTLLVNVTGCFLLGGLSFASGLENAAVSPTFRAALGAGFLGALTTFSTFGAETFDRLHRGQWGLAVTNVTANLVLGLLAVWAGHCLAQFLLDNSG